MAREGNRLRSRAPAAFLVVALLAGGLTSAIGIPGAGVRGAAAASTASSCVDCHAGIEDMHPEAFLSCVDCHGGDATKAAKSEAHVQPQRTPPGDERVLPLDHDEKWLRFVNPMDLRVAAKTCGSCHEKLVEHLRTSLHGTTAGHLSDGFYEVGALDERGSRFGVFPVAPDPARSGDVERLVSLPEMDSRDDPLDLATHYVDLPRKECVQCHLWSSGRAVRGRVGFDGDYRGAGCAACHVPYALDGFSQSADACAVRGEPGHPRTHAMTRAPSVDTCTSCHYGDASIGLAFRGLSQLPPGAPGGPDIPGTTDRLLNRAFYLRDDAICPPDVHFERGMHCIDCHTLADVMGDGALHGAMEHAVEISCEACHGTFKEASTLRTERGTRLEHLRREGDEVILTGKVSGTEHVVPQVVHVLDPAHPEFNERAAEAMNARHAEVECYTCHAAWNVNFVGFHFDRNASFTQLDLLSGRETPGRVTTQEKVFATWKSFYAGLNESGRVAPYMTGFSTMGSVSDASGARILDQVLPVTAAGLSGQSMIHHQTHTVRDTARSCVECHRSPATWGLGSPNFSLARQFAFVADRRGIETVALERTALAASPALTKFVLPDVVDLALDCDPLQGHARRLFAAEGGRGVHVLDATRPHELRHESFTATMQPLGLTLVDQTLYVADGEGGLAILDVAPGKAPRLRGRAPTFEAHDVVVVGSYAYVADGAGGLAIVDVRSSERPRVVAAVKVGMQADVEDAVIAVRVLFQHSRPRADDQGPLKKRTAARMLAAVLDVREGLALFDVTEPTAPQQLYPRASRRTQAGERGRRSFRGIALGSHVDLAEPQGGERTMERDYVWLLSEGGDPNNRRSRVDVLDVSDPERPSRVGNTAAAFASEMLVMANVYNPPFQQNVALVPGELGLTISDLTISARPNQIGAIGGLRQAYAVAVEEFPLDRMVDSAGKPLKDVSHDGSRWLRREEIARILDVPGPILGLPEPEDVFGGDVRELFVRYDADRDGVLAGDELKGVADARADVDGDGRVTLLELGRASGALTDSERREESAPAPEVSSPFAEERVGENGDLARLFDGIDPHTYDGDRNGALDAAELRQVYFAALDLDGDERLTRDETSRAPGELRLLRYPDEAARKTFAALDKNRDDKLTLREFQTPDGEFAVLDRDSNGEIQLWPRLEERLRARVVRGSPEWPQRRRWKAPLPPNDGLTSLLARYDKDGDGELKSGEVAGRPDLFLELDFNGDGRATTQELEGLFRAVDAFGVDALADGLLQRWDLDGDGKLSTSELPGGAWRARLGDFTK